jgi:hypothetical protein
MNLCWHHGALNDWSAPASRYNARTRNARVNATTDVIVACGMNDQEFDHA